MRDFIKANGGMARVIALAVRGAKRAARAAPKVNSFLPDSFPDAAAIEAAVTFWRRAKRPDLEAAIERQIDHFRAHFQDVKRPSWPRTWATWYRNALNFTPVARGLGSGNEAVAFEQTTLDGWRLRVRLFSGLEPDAPAGTWSGKWGPEPGQPGCKVPKNAFPNGTGAFPSTERFL
jgi:hypothetical protein